MPDIFATSGNIEKRRDILAALRQQDVAYGAKHRILKAAGITNIKPSRAGTTASRIMHAATLGGRKVGAQVEFTLRDNAVLDVVFKKAGEIQHIPVPMASGFTVKYLGHEIESHFGLTFSQPGYVVPGVLLESRPEGKRAVSLGEMVAEQFEHGMRSLQWGEETKGLRETKKSVFSIFKNAVWTASDRSGGKYYPPANLDTPAAILHATRMQVMTSGGGPPAEWQALIAGEEGKPFKSTGIDWPEVTRAPREARKRYQEAGFYAKGLTDLSIKPELGLKGYLSSLSLGQVVPFGGYADPVRQAYQTWAVRPLVGRGAGYSRPVTTAAFEGASKVVGEDAFYAAGRFMLTSDPKLESAASLSAGGAIFTEKFLQRLKYKSPSGEIRVPKVGSALQIGRFKVTVGSIVKEISGGVEGILGLQPLAKYGDELRTQIVSNILYDLNKVRDVKNPAKLNFLDQLANIIGATYSTTDEGEHIMSIGKEARLGADELDRIRAQIKIYNSQHPNASIASDLNWTSADIHARGIIQTTGLITSMGAGVRDKSELYGSDAVQWVARPPKKANRLNVSIGGGERYHRWHINTAKRGMKLAMRDALNLKLYGNQEADNVANIMLQAMAGFRAAEKKDIWKALMPMMGGHRVAGGIKIEDIVPLKPIDFTKQTFTEAELAGTFLDPKGKHFTEGLTVELNKPFAVPGLQGPVGLTQIHLVGPKTLGMGRKKIVEGGKSSYVWTLNPLVRTEARAYEAITKGDPGQAVSRWFEEFGAAVTGKKGLLAKYSQPRLAQSAYLRARPMGVGAEAEKLGMALKPVTLPTGELIMAEQTLVLAESDVMAMGRAAQRQFGIGDFAKDVGRETPAGSAWVLAKRDPSQGAAHMGGMLAVVSKDATPRTIGIANVYGLTQRLDFDKDNMSLLLLSGNAGQRVTRMHGLANTQTDILSAAAFLKSQMSAQQDLIRSGGALPKDIYKDFLAKAEASSTFDEMAKNITTQEQVDLFYGTKKITGLVDYRMQQHRNILALSAESKGKHAAGAVYNELSQQAAIAKAKNTELMDIARGLYSFDTSAQRLSNAAMRKEDISKVSDMITKMWNILKTVKAAKAVGLPGELPALLGGKSPEEAANLIQLAATSMVETTAQISGANKRIVRAFGGSKQKGLLDAEGGIEALMAAARTGSQDAIDHYANLVAKVTGYDAALASAGEAGGLVVGSALGKLPAIQQAATDAVQAAGIEGKNIPAPLMDGIINWFKNPKTPALHKAGVVTGSLLLGGAIIKNMMFPNYHPADETSPTHVAVPIPLRMPAYEMPTESIFDDVPMSRSPVDSQFSMPLQYGNMGFRARPPAVQMGAGTMEPGVMPFLTGTPNKGSVPAPMVLNQASYQNEATNPIPQTVRAGAPRESMASSYLPTRGYAEVSAGLDMRSLTRDLSSGSIRFEGYNDRSDREMLGMLEDQEGSNFT